MQAARRASPLSSQISGFYIREARFKSAILISDEAEDANELVVQLRPLDKLGSRAATWSEVRIFAYSHSTCAECFQCIIRTDHGEAAVNKADTDEKELEAREMLGEYTTTREKCTHYLGPKAFYKDLERFSIRYSGCFKALQEAWWSPNGIATTCLEAKSRQHSTTSLVHPALLDAVMQAMQIGNGPEAVSGVTPTRMADAWFASTAWQQIDTGSIRCIKRASKRPTGIFNQQSIHAVTDSGSILCAINVLETMQREAVGGAGDSTEGLLHRVEWKPQLSLLSPGELRRVCDADNIVRDEVGMEEDNGKLDTVLGRVLCETLAEISNEGEERVRGHLSRYLEWMKHKVGQIAHETGHDGEERLQEAQTVDVWHEESEDGFQKVEASQGSLAEGICHEKMENEFQQVEGSQLSLEEEPQQVEVCYEETKDELPQVRVCRKSFKEELQALQACNGKMKDKFHQWSLEEELHQVEALNPAWKLYTSLARQLKSILLGESNALDIMYGTGMADALYLDVFKPICDARLSTLLDLVSHQNPNLRVLEVGAGTGGLTSFILGFLQDKEMQTGTRAFSEYTYTDVSPSFFDTASDKWSALKDRMGFKVFDLERSGASQGLEPGSYNLVIAGCVLHTTSNLPATIQGVRDMLKPNGRLLLVEPIAPESLAAGFPWGLLPGWWRGEEEWRRLSALGDEERWEALLKENGFGGIDVCLRDYASEANRRISVMLTTVEPEIRGQDEGSIYVVVGDEAVGEQVELAEAVLSRRDQFGCVDGEMVLLKEMHTLETCDNDLVVFVGEIAKPLLGDMDSEILNHIRAMVAKAKRLFWVNATTEGDAAMPHFYLAQGLLRSLRSEMPSTQIISLTIEAQDLNPEFIFKYISTVVHDVFCSDSAEVEFIVRNGQLLTGRAVQATVESKHLETLISPGLTTASWESSSQLKLHTGTPGDFDTLHFIQGDEGELRGDEVEIKVQAWAVTRQDVAVAQGRENQEFGFECAGIVSRLGPECILGLQVGDRVVMITPGCMRTNPRASEQLVARIPDNVAMNEVVIMVASALTPCYALLELARLQAGERVLVDDAASDAGQMAVRIALDRGAKVMATAQTSEEMDWVARELAIASDHVLRAGTSLGKQVSRLTSGQGVDIVLNSGGADALASLLDCVAPHGKVVDLNRGDTGWTALLAQSRLAANMTLSSVNVRELLRAKPSRVGAILRDTLDLVARQVLSCPTPLHVFPVSQVCQAFKSVNASNKTEAAVIGIDPLDTVKVRISPFKPPHPNAILTTVYSALYQQVRLGG
ncbi:hypothetical protein CDD81_1456 [Ophiocordyceps australis]|uniref:PKS/mFAS DH domain-containing protein n=1 Tax=Ophiocordyceps australis TaxID=1399860 RepID=A0A2C5XB76_9HYPO|nr:hypothetical protein CDD81_1456 [Ophiocordyceps australis]